MQSWCQNRLELRATKELEFIVVGVARLSICRVKLGNLHDRQTDSRWLARLDASMPIQQERAFVHTLVLFGTLTRFNKTPMMQLPG